MRASTGLARVLWLTTRIRNDSKTAGYYFDVLETVEEPEAIYLGNAGEYLAVREIEKGKYIVVVYKEVNSSDGFIITAFLTRRKKQLEKRKKIWQR